MGERRQPPPPFPWHLAVFDAHCHPTDSMASVADALPAMRAAAVVAIATRAQDQHLVADVAARHAFGPGPGDADDDDDDADDDDDQGAGRRRCRVLPSFGWHPWFSHLLYHDATPEPTYAPPADGSDAHALHLAKRAHYRAVLAPAPDDDLVASLPAPLPLSAVVAATRRRLDVFPHALVGEIGLDKAFRLPRHRDDPDSESDSDAAAPAAPGGLTPGGREGRPLGPHRVRVPHQQAVLRAQLDAAAAHRRPVSLHGVQAHGLLYDALAATWEGHERRVPSRRERRAAAPAPADPDDAGDAPAATAARPYPPRICLHSYSGGVELLARWMHPAVPAKVFVSLSAAVNLAPRAGRPELAPVIRAVPDDRILVESDLHAAGPHVDAALERMYCVVCDAKGWRLDEGVRIIARNFADFVFGRRP